MFVRERSIGAIVKNDLRLVNHILKLVNILKVS